MNGRWGRNEGGIKGRIKGRGREGEKKGRGGGEKRERQVAKIMK